MTQEEKQLLIKDLCARTLYGIKVWYPNGTGVISTVKGIVNGICYFNENPRYGNCCPIESVKPYLRPMSSMTEEEEAFVYNGHIEFWIREDYCNEHHLDFRGLIPMGLALEAPEGMYKQ